MSAQHKLENRKNREGLVILESNLPSGNQKAGRNFCFTWNNYQKTDIQEIISWMESLKGSKNYIIAEEVGESGTPHLQGVLSFGSPKKWSQVKDKFPAAHWEYCRNLKASWEYCKKEGNFIDSKATPYELAMRAYMQETFSNVVWKPWQQSVIDLIETTPNRRTVHWYWEPVGNVGKSFLTEWLVEKYDTIIVNGKQNDVFNGVLTYIKEKKKSPQVVISDIPRTNENYVSYGTLESLKNGVFNSGKYEGGQVHLLPLHLFVFANFYPDVHKMSADRWDIVNIEEFENPVTCDAWCDLVCDTSQMIL